MKKLNVGIIGSRDFNNYEEMCSFVNEYIKLEFIDNVVSGGAKGADKLGEKFALDNDLPLLLFKVDWGKYGRSAGIMRNKDIVDKSDIIFAFWDGISKGTKSTINFAKKVNKQVYICKFNKGNKNDKF